MHCLSHGRIPSLKYLHPWLQSVKPQLPPPGHDKARPMCPTVAPFACRFTMVAQMHSSDTYNFKRVISLRRFKPLAYKLLTTRRLYNYAFQILLIASVMPTSLVSNSYNETPTNIVVIRSVHMRRFLITGTRFFGK